MDPTINPNQPYLSLDNCIHCYIHRCKAAILFKFQVWLSNTSSESDNEENLDATDPILVATNAGAHLSVPKSASISCKQKLHINEGKYKGKARNTCATIVNRNNKHG